MALLRISVGVCGVVLGGFIFALLFSMTQMPEGRPFIGPITMALFSLGALIGGAWNIYEGIKS